MVLVFVWDMVKTKYDTKDYNCEISNTTVDKSGYWLYKVIINDLLIMITYNNKSNLGQSF